VCKAERWDDVIVFADLCTAPICIRNLLEVISIFINFRSDRFHKFPTGSRLLRGYRLRQSSKVAHHRQRRTHFSIPTRGAEKPRRWPASSPRLKCAINLGLEADSLKRTQRTWPAADRLLIIWIIKLSIPLLMMPDTDTNPIRSDPKPPTGPSKTQS